MSIILNQRMRAFLENKQFYNATLQRRAVFDYYYKESFNVNWYDIRSGNSPLSPWNYLNNFLNIDKVKKALNLPEFIMFKRDPGVYENLIVFIKINY